MKKLKLILAVVAALLCLNLVFAGDPKVETADDIATKMVEFVGNDVKLTSEQKEMLKKNALNYATNQLQAQSMTNKDERYELMKTTTANYQAAIDSLLTTDQKIMKEKKQKGRLEDSFKKFNIKL